MQLRQLLPPSYEAGELGRQVVTWPLGQTRRSRVGHALQRLEIDHQLLRALVTVVRLFLEALLDDPLQFGWDVAVLPGDSLRLVVPDHVDGMEVCRSVERPPSGRHLIQHDA